MPGPIDRYKRETYKIKQRTSIVDGKPVFSDTEAQGLSLDMSQDELSAFGKVHNGRVFFIVPIDPAPQMPCQIEFNSVVYDVQKIETLRTLSGVLWGYKLVAFGG